MSEEDNIAEAEFEVENRVEAIQRVSKALLLSSATDDTAEEISSTVDKFEKCFELISSIWNQEDLLIHLFRSVLNYSDSNFILEVFPKMASWSSLHDQLTDDDVTLVCEKLTDKNLKIKFLLETGHTELANEMLQISRPVVQSENDPADEQTPDNSTDQSKEENDCIELNDEMFSILAPKIETVSNVELLKEIVLKMDAENHQNLRKGRDENINQSELVLILANQNHRFFIHFLGLEILKEKGEIGFVVDLVNKRRNTSPMMNNLQAIFAAFTWIQDM